MNNNDRYDNVNRVLKYETLHRGCLEWAITLFSLSTLPNTLVMGIPLFKGMNVNDSGSLTVQIVAVNVSFGTL